MRDLITYLPLLACPLGMGAMMWFMKRSGRRTTDTAPADTRTAAVAADPRHQELTVLRKQVEDLREQMDTQPAVAVADRTR